MTTPLSATPLVSIIIPVWNRAKILPPTIESALGQDYPNCEIIIVDDGSSDGSGEVARSYCKKGAARIITQEHRGVASARNAGILAAKGNFLAFLDSDDLMEKDFVSLHIKTLSDNPQYAFTYSPYWLTEESKEKNLIENNPSKSENLFCAMLCDFFISICTGLYRREAVSAIGGFNEEFSGAEDNEFMLRLTRKYNGLYINVPKIIVRKFPDALSKNHRVNSRIQRRAILLNAPFHTMKKRDLRLLYGRIARIYYVEAQYALNSGDAKRARMCLAQSLKYRPLKIKTLISAATAYCFPRLYRPLRKIKQFFCRKRTGKFDE